MHTCQLILLASIGTSALLDRPNIGKKLARTAGVPTITGVSPRDTYAAVPAPAAFPTVPTGQLPLMPSGGYAQFQNGRFGAGGPSGYVIGPVPGGGGGAVQQAQYASPGPTGNFLPSIPTNGAFAPGLNGAYRIAPALGYAPSGGAGGLAGGQHAKVGGIFPGPTAVGPAAGGFIPSGTTFNGFTGDKYAGAGGAAPAPAVGGFVPGGALPSGVNQYVKPGGIGPGPIGAGPGFASAPSGIGNQYVKTPSIVPGPITGGPGVGGFGPGGTPPGGGYVKPGVVGPGPAITSPTGFIPGGVPNGNQYAFPQGISPGFTAEGPAQGGVAPGGNLGNQYVGTGGVGPSFGGPGMLVTAPVGGQYVAPSKPANGGFIPGAVGPGGLGGGQYVGAGGAAPGAGPAAAGVVPGGAAPAIENVYVGAGGIAPGFVPGGTAPIGNRYVGNGGVSPAPTAPAPSSAAGMTPFGDGQYVGAAGAAPGSGLATVGAVPNGMASGSGVLGGGAPAGGQYTVTGGTAPGPNAAKPTVEGFIPEGHASGNGGGGFVSAGAAEPKNVGVPAGGASAGGVVQYVRSEEPGSASSQIMVPPASDITPGGEGYALGLGPNTVPSPKESRSVGPKLRKTMAIAKGRARDVASISFSGSEADKHGNSSNANRIVDGDIGATTDFKKTKRNNLL